MKNIHVTSTDKPSRLYKTGDFLLLDSKAMPNNTLETKNQHIYITNDEEIKEGDWVIYENGNIVKADEKLIFNCSHEFDEFWRKVILTTDLQLIVDGVQPIDDTFLEWFVKNPSCEEVKIESWQTKGKWDLNYKIIIPSEEPTMITDWLNEYGDPEIYKKVERELELREAAAIGKFAEKKYIERLNNFQSIDFKDGVFEGAKWQQERMYSEEEVEKQKLQFAIEQLNKLDSVLQSKYEILSNMQQEYLGKMKEGQLASKKSGLRLAKEEIRRDIKELEQKLSEL